MKSKEFLKEIKELDSAALRQRAKDISEELMRLRYRQTSGQLDQGHRLGELRRNLARVQTVLRSSN